MSRQPEEKFLKDSKVNARRLAYPFTAIVGQEEMKLALLLNAIDPSIGGVLIMGHRGTGKSTAVRGLAELLPEIKIAADCIYRCDPADGEYQCIDCQLKSSSKRKLRRAKSAVEVVELPLGATEDRVCGSIDIERSLREGRKFFEPGLLARANRNFLYIDEVNLLEDHLVDLLLDVSVSGINRVEREGMSVEHPARFVLVGSGNPEEGELRPQLLDRFGVQVAVTTENDLKKRVEILDRCEAFSRDAYKFSKKFAPQQEDLRKRVARARKLLPSVKIHPQVLEKIAQLAVELKTDGHRGELTIMRAARALAALRNRRRVIEDDVKRVAPMALRHRMRRDPFAESAGEEVVRQTVEQVLSNSSPRRKTTWPVEAVPERSGRTLPTRQPVERPDINEHRKIDWEAPDEPVRSRRLKSATNQRQSTVKKSANSLRGRYVRALPAGHNLKRIAVDATLRALLDRGASRRKTISAADLRFKQFSQKTGAVFILAIDTSGSMAPRRIERAREMANSLLRRSYLRRDSVALVAFREASAEIVLPPSRSILRAARALDSLIVGGGTPLAAGLMAAMKLAKQVQQQQGKRATVLLFTDGNANVPAASEGRAFTDREQRKRVVAEELTKLGASFEEAKLDLFVIGPQEGFNESVAAQDLATMLRARFVRG